jgi:hypothetical protein
MRPQIFRRIGSPEGERDQMIQLIIRFIHPQAVGQKNLTFNVAGNVREARRRGTQFFYFGQ